MNQLHALFTLRNKQAFQRLLDGSVDRGQLSSTTALSVGAGKSWSRSSAPTSTVCNVNAQDWLGRTVLHLACATNDLSAIEYVKLLLAHPAINVNLCDTESNWTALHRALYQGNIPAALLLLQQSDIDVTVKDFEGYTAFDLYNSTVEGTKNLPADTGRVELFTWGSNRNASLGHGDTDDRTNPELVVVPPHDYSVSQGSSNFKLCPIDVQEVAMSRFHTAVVTRETHGNLRVCGFGGSGRLGHTQHTQYDLQSIPKFTHTIATVALGQDHTLALTVSGEVLSWGSNRFSQLGYIIEPHPDNTKEFGRAEEPIQSSPRKVYGPLKRELVRGVAACKTSSACWTSQEIFTWGTNNGQLGYDMHVNAVQILPKKVSKISAGVISISISDHAMAYLSNSYEVFCIWNDKVIKLSFPPRFPSGIQANGPPRALRHRGIKKVTNCDDVFATLSLDGELFIFSAPRLSQTENVVIKPQRVWALRKQFTSVKDVGLGTDGTIIISTESGHVFCRSRTTKPGSAKTPKFQRIPGLQRIINVCANNVGAFAALRGDFKPPPIPLVGNSFVQDIAALQTYLCSPPASDRLQLSPPNELHSPELPIAIEERYNLEMDDDEDDSDIRRNITTIGKLCSAVVCNKHLRGTTMECISSEENRLQQGADVIIETRQGLEFFAHRVILAARCPVFEELLSGTKIIQDQDTGLSFKSEHVKSQFQAPVLFRLLAGGCHSLSLLLLLSYLYTDEFPVVWDPRVAPVFERDLQKLGTSSQQVKLDLGALARVLSITSLFRVVSSPSTVAPSPSLAHDITILLDRTIDYHSVHPVFSSMASESPLIPDVVLRLADKDISCHSTILRARSTFFADFFDDPDWTMNRWDADGTIKVNMTHMRERVIRPLLNYIYGNETVFANIDDSTDDFLEFAFEVMGSANELLLDRLVVLCSRSILEQVNVKNACYILSEATHLNAMLLVESVHGYIAANMETFLESRMLDDMPDHVIQHLTAHIHRKQNEKSPVQRSQQLVELAMKNQSEWLALQDIAQPVIRTGIAGLHKHSPKLSPSNLGKRLQRRPSNIESPIDIATTHAHPTTWVPVSAEDDIFVLDGLGPSTTLPIQPTVPLAQDAETVSRPKGAWKTWSPIPRVDLKILMAEAENDKQQESSQGPSSSSQRTAISTGDGMLGVRAKLAQRPHAKQEHKRELLSTGDIHGDSAIIPSPSPAAVGLPWRKLVAQKPTATHSVGPPTTSSAPGGPHKGIPHPSQDNEEQSSARVYTHETPDNGAAHRQSLRTQLGLGPTISPSRQSPGSASSIRRPSKAWNLPPAQSTIEPSLLGPGASLVAIQDMQSGQDPANSSDKRSLLEIQEEEKARQTEADFLRWWSAEEQKLKAEEEESSPIVKQTRRQRKPRKAKGNVVDGLAKC